MKRAIKFRAWDVEEKQMMDWSTMRQSAFNEGGVNVMYEVMVSRNTDYEIMQFTGICDKNGKEIYEGDIVETTSSKGVIEFDKGLFGVNWDYGTDRKTMLGACGTETNLRVMHDGYNDRLNVIGNVFEHPELIN